MRKINLFAIIMIIVASFTACAANAQAPADNTVTSVQESKETVTGTVEEPENSGERAQTDMINSSSEQDSAKDRITEQPEPTKAPPVEEIALQHLQCLSFADNNDMNISITYAAPGENDAFMSTLNSHHNTQGDTAVTYVTERNQLKERDTCLQIAAITENGITRGLAKEPAVSEMIVPMSEEECAKHAINVAGILAEEMKNGISVVGVDTGVLSRTVTFTVDSLDIRSLLPDIWNDDDASQYTLSAYFYDYWQPGNIHIEGKNSIGDSLLVEIFGSTCTYENTMSQVKYMEESYDKILNAKNTGFSDKELEWFFRYKVDPSEVTGDSASEWLNNYLEGVNGSSRYDCEYVLGYYTEFDEDEISAALDKVSWKEQAYRWLKNSYMAFYVNEYDGTIEDYLAAREDFMSCEWEFTDEQISYAHHKLE